MDYLISSLRGSQYSYSIIIIISQNHNILILALERVPPGHPRRIPLELFSEETLRRIDGLDKEEGNF